MSHPTDTTTGDSGVELSPAEIDHALHVTMQRADELGTQRRRRQGIIGGIGVVALLAGGFGVLKALGEDSEVVIDTADQSAVSIPVSVLAETTIALDPSGTVTIPKPITLDTVPPVDVPATPPTPVGFTSFQDAAGIWNLENQNEIPKLENGSELSSGVDIGGAAFSLRAAEVVRYSVHDGVVHIEFECGGNRGDRIDKVRYVLIGTTLTVETQISGRFAGDDCIEGAGATIDFVPEGGAIDDRLEVVADFVG